MVKLTPNSIRRESGAGLRLERSTNGLYVVQGAYDGSYEFFKDRPLRKRRVATVVVPLKREPAAR